MNLKMLLRFNWVLFASMLALLACGTVAIWSAGNAREAIFHGMWMNHLFTALIGLVLYFLLALTDYRIVIRLVSPVAYAVSLVLLIAVLAFGSTVYGGRRWLWFFQPSEIAKLCTLVFLAGMWAWANALEIPLKGFCAFSAFALAAAVPAALILLEPDLGTTLAFIPAAIAMLVAGDVGRKGVLIAVATGAIAASVVLGAVYEAEKPGQLPEKREAILSHLPLKPHQVKRVKTFLFPESDPMGAGYNLRQSLIAIASGGLSGRGIGKGETNRLKYLPSSVSMNDFIFCVWAEETGYAGSLLLIALYTALCSAGAWIAWAAADTAARMLAIGLVTLVFAHAYINMAMCIGLVPITGLPLPFISSGRTFLVTMMAALGLLQSISIHKEEST